MGKCSQNTTGYAQFSTLAILASSKMAPVWEGNFLLLVEWLTIEFLLCFFSILGGKTCLWSTSQELPSPSWKPMNVGAVSQMMLWKAEPSVGSTWPVSFPPGSPALNLPHVHLNVLPFCKSRHGELGTNFKLGNNTRNLSTNLCWCNTGDCQRMHRESPTELFRNSCFLWLISTL